MRYDVTNAESKGRWSDLGRFYVDERPVALTSPADGAEQAPNGPVLSWLPYTTGTGQAAKYAVEVRTAANTVFESVSSTAATSWATAKNYPTGTYTWTVTGYDASNNVMGSSARAPSRRQAWDAVTPSGSRAGRRRGGPNADQHPPDLEPDRRLLDLPVAPQRREHHRGGEPDVHGDADDVDQSSHCASPATARLHGGTSVSAPLVITAGPPHADRAAQDRGSSRPARPSLRPPARGRAARRSATSGSSTTSRSPKRPGTPTSCAPRRRVAGVGAGDGEQAGYLPGSASSASSPRPSWRRPRRRR